MPEIQEQGEGTVQEAPGRAGRGQTSSVTPSSLPPSQHPSEAPDGRGSLGELDMSPLRKSSLLGKLIGLLVALTLSHFGLRVLRWFRAFRVPGLNLTLVTRFAEVEEVLTHDRVFEVDGDRVKTLNEGPNFLLGLQDGPEYRRYQRLVMSAFKLEDIEQRVAATAGAYARAVIAHSTGSFDAIQKLITGAPIEICRRYYGVPIADEKEFANWTFAISLWLFNPRKPSQGLDQLAREAGARLNRLVEQAIADARAAKQRPDTIIGRLIDAQDPELGKLDDATIRVVVVGMITGFVPTNTMAAGHMLDVLLDRADYLEQARRAARSGDDERLKRCLFEAMRFQPLLREPLRVCAADYMLAEGTRFATTIKKGARVIAVTKSAMFDERIVQRPHAFDPERPAHQLMLFGYGLHRCIGAPLAEAQITQTFKPLLQLPKLRRALAREGKLQRIGPFPERLVIEFDRREAALAKRKQTAAS